MQVKFYTLGRNLFAVDEDENIFGLGGSLIEPQWEDLIKGSPRWDYIHQSLFRRFHGFLLHEAPSDVPPLPPVDESAQRPWTDYFVAEAPIASARFPLTAQMLAASPKQSTEVVALLREDTQETRFGNGEFHVQHHTCLSEAEAREYKAAHTSAEFRFTAKPVRLKLEGEHITFPGFELQLFQYCDQEHVLEDLEKHLQESASEHA